MQGFGAVRAGPKGGKAFVLTSFLAGGIVLVVIYTLYENSHTPNDSPSNPFLRLWQQFWNVVNKGRRWNRNLLKLPSVLYWKTEAFGYGSSCGKIRRKSEEIRRNQIEPTTSFKERKTCSAWRKENRFCDRCKGICESSTQSSKSSIVRRLASILNTKSRPLLDFLIMLYDKKVTYDISIKPEHGHTSLTKN